VYWVIYKEFRHAHILEVWMTLLSSQAQLECKFMIGLSQGLGNGILVLTLDLDGVDADVWGFG
jgi:hypothetical protein